MRILFVAQEIQKISKGTVGVWGTLYQYWPKQTRITILSNRMHWVAESLKLDIQQYANVGYHQLPFLLPSEWVAQWIPVSNQRRLARGLRFVLRSFLTFLFAPFVVIWLALWLRQRQFDGILSQNGGWPAAELSRWIIYAGFIARVPRRVLVIHNMPLKPIWIARPLSWVRDRMMATLATELVTVSHSCKINLEMETGFNRTLKALHNGIPIRDGLLISLPSTPPWPKDRLAVGFIGELAARKGVHVLVEALRGVIQPCDLILVGTGQPDYVRNLALTAERSAHEIRFLGFREDVSTIYPFLDVVVLPSISFESFGMVIVEAMMYEKPVICSDFGGMKEVVVHQETGLVVPAGNPEALALAINTLLTDEALRIRMGKAGRQRLERYFGAETMTAKYVELFSD